MLRKLNRQKFNILSLLKNSCKLRGIFCSYWKFLLHLNQLSPQLHKTCSYQELTKNNTSSRCSGVAGTWGQSLGLWTLSGHVRSSLHPDSSFLTTQGCWSEQLQSKVVFEMHSASANLAHQIPRAFNRISTCYRDFIFGSHT